MSQLSKSILYAHGHSLFMCGSAPAHVMAAELLGNVKHIVGFASLGARLSI